MDTVAVATRFSNQQRDTVKEATEDAKRVVATGCHLDGTDGESSLVAALRDSAISRIQGGGVIVTSRRTP